MSTMINDTPVDVVVLGLGTGGGSVTVELSLAGHSVAGIDKGPYWDYTSDYSQNKYDEWGIALQHRFDHPLYLSSYTLRNNTNQMALPVRQYTSSQSTAVGHGVGGAAQHYNGNMGRTGPWNYTMLSSTLSRYGQAFLNAAVPNNDLQDFPYTYQEQEPYYTAFENGFGICGTNQGPLVPMSQNYQMQGHPTTPLANMYQAATEALGYTPYPTVSSLASQPYVNSYGIQVNPCAYDGWCSQPCVYPCETGAKSNAAYRTIPAAMKTGKFTMSLNSYISRIDLNASGMATGVTYMDAGGNVHFQAATVVFSSLWTLNNYRMFALSGIGTQYNPTTVTGSLGRGVNANGGSGSGRAVTGTVPLGANLYPAGNGSGGGYTIYDFADDNVDHTNMAQPGIGGSTLSVGTYTGSAPSNLGVAGAATVANIGSTYKASLKDRYLRTGTTTVSLAGAGNTVATTDLLTDLDPIYTDLFGDPLTRYSSSYNNNAVGVANLITPLLQPILTKMGAQNITLGAAATNGNSLPNTYGIHIRGGSRVGADPSYSTFNKWHQSWQVQNVFAAGEGCDSNYPVVTMGTHVMAAGAYTAADGIKQYLSNPGMLM